MSRWTVALQNETTHSRDDETHRRVAEMLHVPMADTVEETIAGYLRHGAEGRTPSSVRQGFTVDPVTQGLALHHGYGIAEALRADALGQGFGIVVRHDTAGWGAHARFSDDHAPLITGRIPVARGIVWMTEMPHQGATIEISLRDNPMPDTVLRALLPADAGRVVSHPVLDALAPVAVDMKVLGDQFIRIEMAPMDPVPLVSMREHIGAGGERS